jgi:glutamate N-acetyltransferase / amino-acid N-acetyltransferase
MKLPQGFISGSVAAGLKSNGALDLTVIQNLGPDYFCSAVFTSNKVVAAPVIWSKQISSGGIARAIVLNSGGANACTGPQGFADTHQTAEHLSSLLDISSSEVLVCSTGIIGEFLPMQKILDGISEISTSMSNDGLAQSAQAIMTTDSVPKIANLESEGVVFSGIAKGAGMLAPALATMLCVVMTDAVVSEKAKMIFEEVIERTFNRMDSDGCTSTNDTVVLMSSGASRASLPDELLRQSLMKICSDLVAQLIADAEGSTKTIEINVLNACTENEAVEIARACARNNLLKAAIFGGDPNWGRVLAAVGTAAAEMNPLAINVRLNGVQVCTDSAPDQDKSLVDLSERLVTIDIDMKVGSARATVLTNDLTHAYVHENSAYST